VCVCVCACVRERERERERELAWVGAREVSRREERGRAVKMGVLERVRGGKWRWPLKLEVKRY